MVVSHFTPERRRLTAESLYEPSIELGQILHRVESSRFLRGDNSRHWRVDLDFMIKNHENHDKILEGTYDSGGGPKQTEMEG